MKNKHLLLAAFVFSTFQIFAVNLKEAIDNKLVAVNIAGADYDSMPTSLRNGFAPEMRLVVSNLKNSDIELSLDPGYLFVAVKPGYQPMLLVQNINYKLKPNERQLNYVYAMCTALSKSGPGTDMPFLVSDKASPELVEMARFIASEKYQSHPAQQAVWVLSDNTPVTSIGGTDSALVIALRKQLAVIKHVSVDSLMKLYTYSASQGAASDDLLQYNYSRCDRNLTFTVVDTAIITAGYYDAQGHMIKPLFVNTLFVDGRHSIRYDPYPVSLRGQNYTVKLIKDGRICKEYYYMQ